MRFNETNFEYYKNDYYIIILDNNVTIFKIKKITCI